MSRDEILTVLGFLVSFFGRKRKARLMSAIADAVDAYEGITAIRRMVDQSRTTGASLTLSAEEVATLDDALRPVDRLFSRIKEGAF